MLTEKHLVSVCSEFNHVRSWTVTRFRGMISTQPGSTPLASFKIVTIDALDAPISYTLGNNIGNFILFYILPELSKNNGFREFSVD